MLYNITPYLIKLFGHFGSSNHQYKQVVLPALANMLPKEDNNDAIKLIQQTPFYRFMFKLINLNHRLWLITFIVIIGFSTNFIHGRRSKNTLY